MNTELSNIIQISAPQKVSDSYSSKKDYNTDNKAFSDTLDKAQKSYADKTENTINKDQKDYALKTKDKETSTQKDIPQKEIANEDSNAPVQKQENTESTEETNIVDNNNIQTTTQETTQLQETVLPQQLTQITEQTVENTEENALATATKQQNNNQNLIANEQLIANIDYESSANTDGTVIDEKTLKAILDKAQKNEENAVSKNIQTTNNPLDNLKQDVLSTTTKNIEAVDETTITKVMTPADTEADKAPVIKVTEEVAASVKENTAASLENKDTTSKIKDKAVAQMSSLENTNTVVSQSQTTDSSSNQNGKSLSQNNAQEQIAKMVVEANSNNGQTATNITSDVFVNKLDSQLNIATKASSNPLNQLNQNSIMEQVNKQFEQIQQSGSNKVSIILQPENLGRVSVEIMNSKDGIVAKMLTDNQQVKDLFDKNVEALKSNLSSQGINVNNIKVECTHESANNAMNFEREQFNQTFDNNQNHHNNQTNKSTTASYNSTKAETSDFEETENTISNIKLTNTQTIIKHNGKVDYKV